MRELNNEGGEIKNCFLGFGVDFFFFFGKLATMERACWRHFGAGGGDLAAVSGPS